MLILHFSLTPLAASPIRICKALNLHDGVEARFVQLKDEGYGRHSFEKDLVWSRDKDEVVELANRADVIHLHNYLHLDSIEFDPISFRRFWNESKPIVRQFHSTSNLIARNAKCSVEDVLACPIPKLVISQYPERFYPNARVVPNIVFGEEATEKRGETIRVGYSPSNFRSGRASRWDTKGYPETIKMLKSLRRSARKKGLDCEIDLIEQVTHDECLARKSECHINIDDLTTGSYHMSTLESMVLGSVSLSHIDARVAHYTMKMSDDSGFPCLNVRLEEAEAVLLSLIENPAVVSGIGRRSAEWMKRCWNPYKLANRFIEIYEEISRNPGKSFEPRFDLSDPDDAWMVSDFPDLIWKERQRYWPKLAPKLYLNLRARVGRLAKLRRI